METTTNTQPTPAPQAAPILAHLEETARRAHYWTSFSPEVRGKQIVATYSAELLEDMETVKKYGRDPETYRQRYERKLVEWLNSKGRTASAAVTGPSKFPTARNQKRLNAEQNKWESFREWREAVIAAYKKDAERRRRAEWVEAQGGEVQAAINQLENMKKAHELKKRVNVIIRKAKGADCTAELIAAGLPAKLATEIQDPTQFGGAGYPQFSLTNGLNRIKTQEQHVKKLQAQEAAKQANEETPGAAEKVTQFEGGRLVFNYAADRVQIFHDEKPSREKIDELKRAAFKWAPSVGCWQRQLTSNGAHAAARITGTPYKHPTTNS